MGRGALSRCHPRIAAPGAQRLPALLRTRAREERGKHPAFQGEAPGAPPSRALQDFPGPGAGAAESRAALPGLPAGACQLGQLGRPYPRHAGARALSSVLSGFHGADRHPERNLRLASLVGPYPVLRREPSGVGGGGSRERLRHPLRLPPRPPWWAGGERRSRSAASQRGLVSFTFTSYK